MKISAIYVSTGHNFFGRHGMPAGEHETISVAEVECVTGRGLKGDRFWDYKKEYAGQVTFFDEAVHRALLRELQPSPRSTDAYRRNVITRGADLASLIGKEFTLQGVRFLGMAECKPCYWMEQAVGPGAEKFLKGRGGLRAKILTDGKLRVDCPTESAVLLAGGHSRRMGRDKALVEWNGSALGERQAATLASTGAWPLLLSCRSDQPWIPAGFRRVEDRASDGGVMEALVTAWNATTARVLVVLAVDVPLVTADFLDRLSAEARDSEMSVVPRVGDRFEPLVAAWHQSARDALAEGVRRGESLQEVCGRMHREGSLRVINLTPDEAWQLANINTPDERMRLQRESGARFA